MSIIIDNTHLIECMVLSRWRLIKSRIYYVWLIQKINKKKKELGSDDRDGEQTGKKGSGWPRLHCPFTRRLLQYIADWFGEWNILLLLVAVYKKGLDDWLVNCILKGRPMDWKGEVISQGWTDSLTDSARPVERSSSLEQKTRWEI